ncbi:glycoside hydrolase family 2 protein [Paenibacillus contaminans]|uniref:glycoside hydrolase family 2 protein n=1 Tax=Paenibacillus contaminans TaxID=450362 RepID=UPI001314BE7D|nr:glycoside hydrolase family 2 TIM barrel-domain containing protein [Paenibacillus contaminans]
MQRHTVEIRDWRYQIDHDDLGESRGWFQPGFEKSGWMAVEAPKAWDLYGESFWGYEGIGWFAAEIGPELIQSDILQKIVFNSVSGYSKVWVNGRLLGDNYGAYLPFEFDLTPYIREDGCNEIVLRTDNRHREEWLPGGPVVEWVQYGGILQKVTLESRGKRHLASLRVHTAMASGDKALLVCQMEIANRTAEPFHGTIMLELPAENRTIASEHAVSCPPDESAFFRFEIEVEGAKLWSLESPSLYTLRAKLSDGLTILDELGQRFGIRTIETSGKRILLNGKPIMLKGFNRYDEYAGYGPTVPESVIREDLLNIKRTGANLIRVHYPQSPAHLDIMDEIGLLYMGEVPLNWWLTEGAGRTFIPEVVDKAEKVLEGMIRRDWNHPCIICWSMSNESGTNSEDGIVSVRRLLRRARELDPKRLLTFVTIGSPGHAAFEEADLVCINLYYGLFHQQAAVDISELDELVRAKTEKHLIATSEEYAGKPVVLTEFGAPGIYGMEGNSRFTETYQVAYLEHIWKAVVNSGVQGAVVWSWADYYHRWDFIGAWKAPYGPYGVVTIDRKEKKALQAITRFFAAESLQGGDENEVV